MHANYLIIDFEATCSDDDTVSRNEMEIIEIGAVMVSAASYQRLAEFQSFVRPIRHRQLTDFCTRLTHISQSQVDAAPRFPQVHADFVTWANEFPAFIFCSWGEYDRRQLTRDCDYHQVEYPFGREHVNLKAKFAAVTGQRKMGVPDALRHVGLPFVGTHHRGIDDARNIASLVPFIFSADAGAIDDENSTGD